MNPCATSFSLQP